MAIQAGVEGVYILHKPVRRVGCPYGDARADLSPVEFKAEASFEGGEDVAST